MAGSFLRIGGIAIEVIYRDPQLHLPWTLAHEVFAIDPVTPDLRIEVVRLESYAMPDGPLLFDSGAVWQLFSDRGGFRIECRSPTFGEVPYKIASINTDLTQVTVEVRVMENNIPNALEYPLDELFVNSLLTLRSGIELHACGVIDEDGSGYLFAGNSGDGKTTTARLWLKEGAEVISDDRIIVREDQGNWWMYGTPWHGEAEICTASRAPLRRIFLLAQSEGNASEAVPQSEAVARLVACAFPPFHDRSGLETLLTSLQSISAAVPVTRLSFTNDPRAVAVVRALGLSSFTS